MCITDVICSSWALMLCISTLSASCVALSAAISAWWVSLIIVIWLCLPAVFSIRIAREPSAAVHEVFELAWSQLCGLDSQHEGDGVHQVGLARAIRADDRSKVAERSNNLVASVWLEVADLDAYERHRGARVVEETGEACAKAATRRTRWWLALNRRL